MVSTRLASAGRNTRFGARPVLLSRALLFATPLCNSLGSFPLCTNEQNNNKDVNMSVCGLAVEFLDFRSESTCKGPY